MSDAQSGQVNASAAEVYENFFVPALFAEPAAKAVTAAGVASGQRVLDVACGTGVLARRAARAVGATGEVVGLDVNPGMLAVAKREAPKITWHEADAGKLPFEDASFDAVFCQFGLMFFPDREAALKEMWRVLKPQGTLTVSVWSAIEKSPGYAAMADLLRKLFGDDAAEAMHAPFVLGDADKLAALLERAGIAGAKVTTLEIMARFPSLEAWVHTDIRGWTLADMINDADYARLQDAAKTELAPFVGPSGAVSFPSPALLALATKT